LEERLTQIEAHLAKDKIDSDEKESSSYSSSTSEKWKF